MITIFCKVDFAPLTSRSYKAFLTIPLLQGHELTLRVLYRLYREIEQDQDFLSSRTATSVYETFLLTVVSFNYYIFSFSFCCCSHFFVLSRSLLLQAETLRDTFPASDKSLGRLLCEVPYLPEGILKLLEGLCSPKSNVRQDRESQSGDRVTQGLSAVWNLIVQRPSNRDRCLLIALQVLKLELYMQLTF